MDDGKSFRTVLVRLTEGLKSRGLIKDVKSQIALGLSQARLEDKSTKSKHHRHIFMSSWWTRGQEEVIGCLIMFSYAILVDQED